jgi:hypothetical protein
MADRSAPQLVHLQICCDLSDHLAGGGRLWLANVSAIAKRISFILFALFFLLAAIVFAPAFVVS